MPLFSATHGYKQKISKYPRVWTELLYALRKDVCMMMADGVSCTTAAYCVRDAGEQVQTNPKDNNALNFFLKFRMLFHKVLCFLDF